jgi:3-phenylpropionate/trans-cinnamate dioxygenase ferredoxin subunit
MFPDSYHPHMTEKKYKWHKVADSLGEIEFASNNIAVVDLNGKNICLGKSNGVVFAFAYKCPHAGGVLAEGFIDALGNVVCPLHRYKYNIANGRNVSGEGYYLKHWPVQVKEDGIFVGVEETGGLFGLFK